MKKNAPLCTGITAIIFFIYSILSMVQSGRALSSLSDLPNVGGYVSFARGIAVFDLIVTIIILLVSVVLFVLAIKRVADKALYATTGSLIGFYSLTSIIEVFLAYGLLKKMFGDNISMPGASIAQLIFLFIALIFAIAGLFTLKSFMYEDKAGIVFIISCVSLIVCLIINFANMNSNTEGLTIVTSIFILIGLLSAGFEYINSYGSSGYKYKKPTTHYGYHPSSYSSPSSSSGNEDATEQLRKLKKLLDDGIITSQEYEEKRKKYVDKL